MKHIILRTSPFQSRLIHFFTNLLKKKFPHFRVFWLSVVCLTHKANPYYFVQTTAILPIYTICHRKYSPTWSLLIISFTIFQYQPEVLLSSITRFSERGKIFSKEEIRSIQTGPNGLFFTGDGSGELKVWKWS